MVCHMRGTRVERKEREVEERVSRLERPVLEKEEKEGREAEWQHGNEELLLGGSRRCVPMRRMISAGKEGILEAPSGVELPMTGVRPVSRLCGVPFVGECEEVSASRASIVPRVLLGSPFEMVRESISLTASAMVGCAGLVIADPWFGARHAIVNL